MPKGDIQRLSAVLLCSMMLGCGKGTPEPSKTPPAASGGVPAQVTPQSAAPETSPPTSAQPAGPAPVFTVKEVRDIEKAGEAAFSEKLANKSIELVGEVWNFEGKEPAWRKSDGVLFAPVLAASGTNQIATVKCYMAEDEPWKKVKPGQIVHIKGTVASKWDSLTGFAMQRCEVTKAEPLETPLITIDVDDLATEFVTDADAFEAKFKDKSFIVTGKLAVIPYTQGEVIKEAFSLSAPDGVTVVGRLSSHYLDKLKSEHKSGDMLRLLVPPGMRVKRGDKYIDLRFVHDIVENKTVTTAGDNED